MTNEQAVTIDLTEDVFPIFKKDENAGYYKELIDLISKITDKLEAYHDEQELYTTDPLYNRLNESADENVKQLIADISELIDSAE